jgi:DNA-binding transcriptional regulator YiaG
MASQFSQMKSPKSFAARILAARTKAGLSQKKAAQAWGFVHDTLCSWEQGERSPSGLYRAKLEKILKKAGA